jgi:glutaredoxin-like protein NrdH
MSAGIKLYGLMSCAHCREMREFLVERSIPFNCVYLDLLIGDERSDTLRELRNINAEVTFPTMVIGDRVIVGFKKDQIESALTELGYTPQPK